MPSTDKAVVVDGIRKSFGSVVALRDISFEVGRGEVLGLARAQRGRQDDDGGHPVDADAARSRPRDGRRA